jgi:hypothetical protein
MHEATRSRLSATQSPGVGVEAIRIAKIDAE